MRHVHEMLGNLEAQVDVYRRLLNLTQAQVVALRERDVKTVHAVLQEIELGMLDRARIDQQREMLLINLSAQLGVPKEEITVTLLQGLVDAPIADLLAGHSQELRSLIGELDVVVTRSRALLEQELELIDQVVKTTTRRGDALTYARTGTRPDADRLKLLDAQV